MKFHTTITITRSELEAKGACTRGLAAASALLPAKVSTDPEQNIELALAFVEQCDGANWRALDFLYWYATAAYDYAAAYDADAADAANDAAYDADAYASDISLVAQVLAIIADAVACNQGK